MKDEKALKQAPTLTVKALSELRSTAALYDAVEWTVHESQSFRVDQVAEERDLPALFGLLAQGLTDSLKTHRAEDIAAGRHPAVVDTAGGRVYGLYVELEYTGRYSDGYYIFKDFNPEARSSKLKVAIRHFGVPFTPTPPYYNDYSELYARIIHEYGSFERMIQETELYWCVEEAGYKSTCNAFANKAECHFDCHEIVGFARALDLEADEIDRFFFKTVKVPFKVDEEEETDELTPDQGRE